jgi:TRAP-type C4-dicarboxylate transport system permease small subunit
MSAVLTKAQARPPAQLRIQTQAFRVGLALSNWADRIAALLLIAVVAMNVAQIIFRYVLIDPLSWSEETMRYSTVWMVLLAGSSALFRGEHMEISIFDKVRSDRVRNAIRLLVLSCIALFCLLLMWEGFRAAIQNIEQRSPAVEIPMVIPYLAIPVGAALMLVKLVCLMALPELAYANQMKKGEGE